MDRSCILLLHMYLCNSTVRITTLLHIFKLVLSINTVRSCYLFENQTHGLHFKITVLIYVYYYQKISIEIVLTLGSRRLTRALKKHDKLSSNFQFLLPW